jgi:hypothetical protein
MRSWCVQLAVVLAAMVASAAGPAARAADLSSFCADCQVQLGIGGTYHFWARTGSLVVPLTMVFDQDRYEIGAFRMASSQGFYDSTFGAQVHFANPYWGFSASRRWELFRHRYWRMLFGFGGSYKTEEDTLSASHWNFAEQLGVRVTPTRGFAIELVARHWSNAGLKLPNHGQDFATLSFSIYPGVFGNRFAAQP